MKSVALPVVLCALLGSLSLACASNSAASPDAGIATPDAVPTNPLIQARPYGLNVPTNYDPAKPTSLVVILHGYSASGFVQAAYFGLLGASERHGFLLAYPDGTVDSMGHPFWNATDGCCNFDNSPVDDVAYLTAILDDVEARYNIDPKRVFFIGHSNGAFMSHRMACEKGDRIAAIVTLAGMTWLDPTKCPAHDKVNVRQVQGDADQTIAYAGTTAYPSSAVTVATWAAKNGCTGMLVDDGPPLDLDTSLPGAETTRQTFTGCPPGGAVDFWTIHGGKHLPIFDSTIWSDTVWQYFDTHAKP